MAAPTGMPEVSQLRTPSTSTPPRLPETNTRPLNWPAPTPIVPMLTAFTVPARSPAVIIRALMLPETVMPSVGPDTPRPMVPATSLPTSITPICGARMLCTWTLRVTREPTVSAAVMSAMAPSPLVPNAPLTIARPMLPPVRLLMLITFGAAPPATSTHEKGMPSARLVSMTPGLRICPMFRPPRMFPFAAAMLPRSSPGIVIAARMSPVVAPMLPSMLPPLPSVIVPSRLSLAWMLPPAPMWRPTLMMPATAPEAAAMGPLRSRPIEISENVPPPMELLEDTMLPFMLLPTAIPAVMLPVAVMVPDVPTLLPTRIWPLIEPPDANNIPSMLLLTVMAPSRVCPMIMPPARMSWPTVTAPMTDEAAMMAPDVPMSWPTMMVAEVLATGLPMEIVPFRSLLIRMTDRIVSTAEMLPLMLLPTEMAPTSCAPDRMAPPAPTLRPIVMSPSISAPVVMRPFRSLPTTMGELMARVTLEIPPHTVLPTRTTALVPPRRPMLLVAVMVPAVLPCAPRLSPTVMKPVMFPTRFPRVSPLVIAATMLPAVPTLPLTRMLPAMLPPVTPIRPLRLPGELVLPVLPRMLMLPVMLPLTTVICPAVMSPGMLMLLWMSPLVARMLPLKVRPRVTGPLMLPLAVPMVPVKALPTLKPCVMPALVSRMLPLRLRPTVMAVPMPAVPRTVMLASMSVVAAKLAELSMLPPMSIRPLRNVPAVRVPVTLSGIGLTISMFV